MAAPATSAQSLPSHNKEPAADVKVIGLDAVAPTGHYGDWPNDIAFDAQEEQLQPKELRVIGKIPAWCAGRLLRTGPSASRFPSTKTKGGEFKIDHWFDAFSHIHKFDMEPTPDGGVRVFYRSRRQVDELVAKAQKEGRLDKITFAQKRDPCDSLFKKFKTVLEPTFHNRPGLENIGIAFQPTLAPVMLNGSGHNDKSRVYTCTSDNSVLKSFDLETLEPFGVVDQSKLHPALDGQLSGTHAGKDPETGDIFNYNLKLSARATYRVFRTKASDGTTQVLATIGGLDPCYLHSALLSENYYILCVWPAKFSSSGVSVLWNRNLVDSIAPFDRGDETTWVIIDRKHGRGEIARFTSPAMFCFHTTNAWEKQTPEGVDLMCELVEYETTAVMSQLYLDKLRSSKRPGPAKMKTPAMNIVRYRLRLAADGTSARRGPGSGRKPRAECVMRANGDNSVELPTWNAAWMFQEHRFVYGFTSQGYATTADGIGKTDMTTGEMKTWRRHAQTPGEAVFVANPAGNSEDDGMLLSVVLDGLVGKSYLLCLDARTMEEVGRAETETVVALGTHGVHLPQA